MDNLRAVSKDQRAAYLSSLSRAELQKVAKEAGLKANVKSSILMANLLEKLDSEEGLVDDCFTTTSATAEQLESAQPGSRITAAPVETISDVGGEVEAALLHTISPCAVAGEEENSVFGLQASPASGSLMKPVTVPSGVQQNKSPVRLLLEPNAAVRDNGAAGQPVETQTTGVGAPARGVEHFLASCAQDFEECMSQTLQDAVANLEPARHEGLADCLCPLESLQDQPIQSISISPYLNKHQFSARPSPWIHEPPPAAASVDLDAAIAAADTSFADCCADVEFLEMAIQDPAPSPRPAVEYSLNIERGERQPGPGHIAIPEASSMSQPSGFLLNSPPRTALPSEPSPALIRDDVADSGTKGESHLEDLPHARPGSPVAPSVEAMAEVNHENRDCPAALPCTGDEAKAPSVFENNGQTFEQAEHPQSSQRPEGIQHRLDESRLTISSSNFQLDATGETRNGMIERTGNAQSSQCRQEQDELKKSNSGTSWPIPSIADVEAKSSQLAASGFTTVKSPNIRPSSRMLLLSKAAVEGQKRPRDGHMDVEESAKKRPALSSQQTASKLAQPAREPFKAVENKINNAVNGQSSQKKPQQTAVQKARPGNNHIFPGPRTFGFPASSTQDDRRKGSYQTATVRSGIPSVKPRK